MENEKINYYTRFKPGAEEATAANLAAVTKANGQLEKCRMRLADEENASERLSVQIKKLKELAGESLTGDKAAFEKFKTSLRNRNAELEISQEAARLLKDEVEPGLRKKLTEAGSLFEGSLDRFGFNSAAIVKEEIDENLAEVGRLLTACDSINQCFLEAFVQIYADFGIKSKYSDTRIEANELRFHPKPFPWPADEIDTLRIKLKMDGLSTKAQRVIETQKRKDEIAEHNQEQLAGVKPTSEAPVTYPTVGR